MLGSAIFAQPTCSCDDSPWLSAAL